MIPEIKELNFPKYATLSQATCTLQDMAEKTITTQVKIDGSITPDFSYDWAIEFKGEKYIMPLRQPQAAKENTSLNSTIDLTFQHWAQYQLKRWYFFTIQPIESGTAVPDKYIASVSLNLGDFCKLFAQVLNYYYGDSITIDLNPEWEFAEEPVTVDISYSYLWDVLIKFYELWAVRWTIEPNGNSNKYVIKVGYPTSELSHIFEYGFNGGLLKVERQVQDENIRNMLLGRGGEKNLPYRYFKDIDPNNPSFPADPDWIPELRNIYFSELRGKTFRDYVKGWKTNPHRQLTEADGTQIAPYVVTGDAGIGSQTTVLPAISGATDMMPGERISISLDSDKNKPLEIPEGCKGNFREGSIIINVCSETKILLFHFILGSKTQEELSSTVEISIANIILTNRKTGETRSSVGIPEGLYDYKITFDLYNKSDKNVKIDWICSNPKLMYSAIREVHQDFGNPLVVEPYDQSYADESWAYRRGHEDEKFDPVEYVKDDSSIAKYGELMGGLENNEEIYPSIQGVVIDHYGRVDEVVDVEPITSDDIEEYAEKESSFTSQTVGGSAMSIPPSSYKEIINPRVRFTVDSGKYANIDAEISIVFVSMYVNGYNLKELDAALITEPPTYTINVYNATTGEKRSASGIPAGDYYYEIVIRVKNTTLDKTVNITTNGKINILSSTIDENQWTNTWNIWIKNIWGTEKKSGETDAQYVERVWQPILGDNEGSETKVVFSTGMLSTSEDYEFMIAKGGIHYDTSKTLNGVPSHWRLTLGKCDADLESTGLYLPSTMRQAAAGDHFFFIGIDMPHQYVLWAEDRLDNYKTGNLDEVKDIKPTWVVRLDKVRINNRQQGEAQTLISRLHVGDSIRLADKRFIINDEGSTAAYEILYLQSITYNYNEPSSSSPALVPDVEVVLSDKYETIANPVATLSGEVRALANQVGSLSNVEQIIRAIGDKLYLRKDGISDRSMSPTEFFSLIKGRDFRSGIVGGASWGIYQDTNGNWVVEADRFKARQDFEVNNLVINQIVARGGMIVESAAQMEVTHVEETDDGYVCYFDQKMGSVSNLFHVDDVAYCTRFTSENQRLKYYKRRVVAIADNSITLTKGYAPVVSTNGIVDRGVNGDGIPDKGDIIVQYGNYTDPARRYAKIYDVIGGGYERYLEGLDSVNAAGKEYYFAGKQDGQSPRLLIGDKDGNYAEWRDGNLYIKGNIDMTAGSSLQDVDEFKNLENKVDNLEIGGRNLLLNTQEFTDKWGGPNGIKQEEKYLGLTVYYGNNSTIRSTSSGVAPRILYNQEYTLSIYAKGTGVLYATMFIAGCKITATNGNQECIGKAVGEFPLSSEWKRYFITFRVNGSSDTVQALMLFSTANSPAYICGAKLEKGNIPTDWSPAPEDIEEKVPSDLQFIKQIFPNGLINNAATISQLLAVRDSTAEDAKIVAGIYGGGVDNLEKNYGFEDKDHGKLMIFAGASDINSVADAGTRIYEDGTIITNKLIATNADITGKIDATSGTFGPLEFGQRGLLTTSTEYGTRTTTIKGGGTWWKDEFSFNGEKHSYSVIVGNVWEYTEGENNPISISCNSTSVTYSNIGIRLDVKGTIYNKSLSTAGNHAIFIDNGDISLLKGRIRGFRLNTVRITYSQTIQTMDSILLVDSTSAITLTLPYAPEDGQIYFIKKINTGGITLKVDVTDHYINDGSTSKKPSWYWTDGCFVIVVWDAVNKRWQAGYTKNN